MPKNIIIFSDGTGQEGGVGANTNIYKLFNMIEDRTERQIAFYDRGLGTGVHKITGSVGGYGISRNIRDCYRFLFENYNAGDRIYLFGFSRGAATMRSLSSFIHYFGILPQSRPELIARAYRIYQISNKEKREQKAADFIGRHHTMWARIRFLGCYDTVAALGLPWPAISAIMEMCPLFRHNFHDFRLSKCVDHACQALAIDDQRKAFHPVLWDEECEHGQSIRQVWFSGMHTDVGGGYPEQALSDIPLNWLTDQAVDLGLHIYGKHKVSIREDINGFMHDSRDSLWKRIIYRRKTRQWDTSRKQKPVIHQSVLQRTTGVDNSETSPYKPWILSLDHEVEPWVKYENMHWSNNKQQSNR